MAITAETEGVGSFEWAPGGARLAFALPEKESKTEKSAKERYGAFAVEDTDLRRSHLWLIEFGPGLFNPTELPCRAEVSCDLAGLPIGMVTNRMPNNEPSIIATQNFFISFFMVL